MKFRQHIPYGSEVVAYKQRFAKGQTIQQLTSSPKGNDRSPESNVPRSNLISKKHINGPWKPEAQNRTRPIFYACPGYQQLKIIRSKMNECVWIRV